MVADVRKATRGGNIEAQRIRASVTRAAILSAARALFAEAGYHATGTNEIVLRAQMTRGALYHHFSDKEDLFEQVCRLVAEELRNRSTAAVADLVGDIWSRVSEAFRQYLLLIATSSEYRRILLIDGPAVLGWTRWRDLQSEFVAQGTALALQLLINNGQVEHQSTMALAYMIQAALHDAALTIANAPSPEEAVEPVMAAFLFLLRGTSHCPREELLE